MRPEIAELTSDVFYPGLLNHPSVEAFPRVEGIAANLYFVTHTHRESMAGESTSRSNAHEAQFMLQLCSYLVHVGYAAEDIVLLTTYLGQQRLISQV